MMSDQMRDAFATAGEGEIPFVSKSKVKKWRTCPRQFKHEVVDDRPSGDDSDEGSTEAKERGIAIHETIETFYENGIEYVERHGDVPERLVHLLPEDRTSWEPYLDPFITNFIAFETRRLDTAESPEDWAAVAVEEEAWTDHTPPWMGLADALLPAASFPTALVSADTGVVLIDFKTGSVPHPDWRDDGIFVDLEYYAMLFDDAYDIVAIGGYYPREDEVIITARSDERQAAIAADIDAMTSATPSCAADYPPKEQALCCWGPGEDQRCPYYDECPSRWAVPVDDQTGFAEACRTHDSPEAVAETLQIPVAAVEYWIRKLNR